MVRWRGTGARYRDYLLMMGLSESTVRVYERLLERAGEWCDDEGVNLTTLRAADAARLATIVPKTCGSRRQLRTALRYYWELIEVPNPPVRAIPVPKKPPGRWRGLEPDDAARLVKASRGWHPEGTAVLLGLGLGLRRAEIAGLRWDCFDRDLEWVTILGKGDRTRHLSVHPGLARELHPTAHPFVFPGHKGRAHVHPFTVENWLHRVCDAAGLRRVSPHVLRHTAIGTMHDETEDIAVAAAFAGHARIETTQIYTRVKAERLRAATLALSYMD